MCFSAGASFTASSLLTIGGIYILSQVRNKKEVLFAAIPLIFALQQAFEGLLWVSFANNWSPAITAIGTYGFLFFAIPFWPLWVPLSTFVMEDHQIIRKILFFFLLLGIVMFAFSLVSIILTGAASQVLSCHIKYTIESPYISNDIVLALYAAATIVPLFISSAPFMRLFGVVVLASLFAAAYFYSNFFISTWCFFSAVLSILIFIVVHYHAKNSRT